MKKTLFVINTLGRAGAETALIELLRTLSEEGRADGKAEYDISLYVLMGQGELAAEIPPNVRLLNKKYSTKSVLSREGKRDMHKSILRSMFKRGAVIKNLPYILKNLTRMIKKGHVWPDKLLWKTLSDGADFFDDEYDLAVAYIEGGSAYYVANHVKAKKKAAFIHIDYGKAGYTRELDLGCYDAYDAIFAVSDEVRERFVEAYPEHKDKVGVFHNIIDQKRLREMAGDSGGFDDGFKGKRILTVGRLTYQKSYPTAIDAMKILKEKKLDVRWYVIGEGPERRALERKIAKEGLEKDFVLLGAKKNPYPYFKQTDLYVHATGFEGKSIAIQEAQTLGCAIIASDSSGNREQIVDGEDGILCALDAADIARAVEYALQNEDELKKFKRRAAAKKIGGGSELGKLLNLMGD